MLSEDTACSRRSEELQEYLFYIAEKTGMLNEEAIDKEDEIYQRWNGKKEISVKEFFSHAIEQGWVTEGFVTRKQGYFTIDDRYRLLAEAITEKLEHDSEFEKILFRRLIFEDKISERASDSRRNPSDLPDGCCHTPDKKPAPVLFPFPAVPQPPTQSRGLRPAARASAPDALSFL